MRNSAIIQLSISLLAGNACSPPSDNKGLQDKAMEEILDSLVQPYIDSSKIAGLAIGVAQNDTILLLKSYGYADLVFDVPLPASASFEIGSVTIEQLMNHTSGIKGYTEMPVFKNLSVHDYPRDTLLRIIEKLTGQSYEEYLSENIFMPAGMNNSYYGDEGKLLKAGYLDQTWPYSAGSLCSTVEDLLKWNHTLHTTETFLKRGLYEELISPSELMDGTRLRYAKGLLVDKYNGTDVISHGGGINGFLSDSRYFPEHDLAIVTLINSTAPIDPESISNVVTDLLIPGQEENPDLEYEGDITILLGTYAGRARGREIELKTDIFHQYKQPN